MQSAGIRGFEFPTSTFNFVLNSPVTSVRTDFSLALVSPNNSSHRRSRSRGGSLDRRAKNIDRRLSHSSSPPTTKTSQHEPGPGLGQGPEDSKLQDVELTVENNVFHSDMITKVTKIIDDCKALGIGQDIVLPRLVLAGERSSGKSSLLENLTGLPVPMMTGQGTRFPIEFKMVSDIDKYGIKSRIIPNGIFTNLDPKKVQEFNDKKELTRSMRDIEFMELLREVSVILDVPPPVLASDSLQDSELGRKSTISCHCLQIEICGPNFVPLSIIDTPGLYRTSGDLREIGLAMEVQNLVEGLVKDKRNIIIAVMEAPQQCTGPDIFQIAKRFDPFGERTLGVLTKCDCVSDGESEAFQAVLKTAQNKKSLLKHGWYVIKNRSSLEAMRGMSVVEARRKESVLFSGIPWHPFASRLEEGRMGIDALRKGLSHIYVHQVQAELPGLTQKIRDQLAIKKAELQAREEKISMDQRSYLKNNISKYKSRADKCLRDESNEGAKGGADHLTVQLENCIKTLQKTLTWGEGKVRVLYNEIDTSILYDGELGDWSGIYTWINERYQNIPGYKIPGCVPESFITELFIEQISPWEKIIGDFSTKISRTFQEAMLECCQFDHDKDKLLQHKCEELVLKVLEAKMDEFRQECLTRSKYEPSHLLKDETEKRVFEKQIRETRLKLLKSAVARLADPSGLTNTKKLAEYLNSDQHAVFQIHDVLRALFFTAREDYMDWIAMSFLGLDYIKEVMDVYNDHLFDALSNEEINALFRPDLEAGKAMKALEDVIKMLDTVLKDLEAIVEKPYSFGSGTKPVDATTNGSSDMPIRTKSGQGLVR